MISSILLAAGMSSRMGTLKPLLDWEGEPLIHYQIRQLHEAGVDEVIAVLGYHSDDIRRTLHGLDYRAVNNPRYQFGRAGSLRLGAKAVSRDAESVVILNVDQPRSADLIRSLLAAHSPESAATRPAHGGRHGHPIVVSARLLPELLTASDETRGLHGILDAHAGEIADIEADESCLTDLNTPADYDAARAATSAGG